MMETKKQWVQPELIILQRGTPEEAVLSTCKYGGMAILNTTTDNSNCNESAGFSCASCNTNLAS